jgi:hypothetical protein
MKYKIALLAVLSSCLAYADNTAIKAQLMDIGRGSNQLNTYFRKLPQIFLIYIQ